MAQEKTETLHIKVPKIVYLALKKKAEKSNGATLHGYARWILLNVANGNIKIPK